MITAYRFRWLVSVLALLLPGLGWGGEILDRIIRRDQINVGYRTDAPPFSFHDAAKMPIGYSIDVCRAIVERIRAAAGKPAMPARYIQVEADHLARVVSSGGVDLMCAGTSDTQERRRTMDFSPVIFLSPIKLMVRAQDKLVSARQLEQKTVAVIGRTTAEGAVNAYSVGTGLKMKVSRVVTSQAALSQLSLGQADAYARDEVLLVNQRALAARPSDFTMLPEPISVEKIAIALPKGDPELQAVVADAIALQVRGGQLAVAYDQWFVKPHAGSKAGLNLPMSAALKQELDKLR